MQTQKSLKFLLRSAAAEISGSWLSRMPWFFARIRLLCQQHKQLLVTFSCWKSLILSTFLLVPVLLPSQFYRGSNGLAITSELEHSFFAPLLQWDSEHYIKLAIEGYEKGTVTSNAFYPLLPSLIRSVGTVTGSMPVAGVLCTTLLGFLFLLYFQKFVSTLYDESTVQKSVLLVLCYPTAFFLSAIYSEVLFLFLLFAFLFYHEKRSWLVVPFCFLLTLCRGQGLFVLGAYGLVFVLTKFHRRDPTISWRYGLTNAAAFSLGFLVVLASWDINAGSLLAGFEAQKLFPFNNSVANMFDIGQTLEYLGSRPTEFFSFTNSIFDKIFMAIMIVLLAFAFWKEVPLTGVVAVFLLIPPILMGEGGSYARFSLLGFPFIAVGIAKHVKNDRHLWPIYAASILIQFFLVMRFSFNHWVG